MSRILYEEHESVQAAADEFLRALADNPQAHPDRIHRARAKLAGQMRRHRASEEELVFNPFMAAGGFERLPAVLPHVQALRQEWLNYSAHVRIWTPQAIERDWDGYTRGVEHRIQILRTLTPYEEQEVYAPILTFLGQQGLTSTAA